MIAAKIEAIRERRRSREMMKAFMEEPPRGIITMHRSGVGLRDRFAGQAMQGFCGSGEAAPTEQYHFNNLAEDAYRLADAMMKARAA